MAIFNATSILIGAFFDELESAQRRMYPGLTREFGGVIRAAGTMAMEIIANTNAFYHSTETMKCTQSRVLTLPSRRNLPCRISWPTRVTIMLCSVL